MLEVKGHNVIVGIDRSGSMDTRDCDGSTRYNFLKEKLVAFVDAAVPDAAGNKVTGIFFGASIKDAVFLSGADASNALNSIRPGGSTATHLAINAAYQNAKRTDAPTMFFLVTDGEPDDTKAVDREIVNITKQLQNPEDFRIMVLTVGKRSSELQNWLEHLDSELDGAKFDIVGLNDLTEVDFREAAAELIASTTSNSDAEDGNTAGKKTARID